MALVAAAYPQLCSSHERACVRCRATGSYTEERFDSGHDDPAGNASGYACSRASHPGAHARSWLRRVNPPGFVSVGNQCFLKLHEVSRLNSSRTQVTQQGIFIARLRQLHGLRDLTAADGYVGCAAVEIVCIDDLSCLVPCR